MGGKVWSKREEFIFWVLLAIFFPPGLHQETKGVKKGRSDILKSWEPFPEKMIEIWLKRYPGEEPPRKYTAVSMYEHYFQNFVQGKLSPNAKPYVEKYKAWLKKKAENPESGSDNEESESRELSMDSESSESAVPESSEAKESEPSETAVSIATSAISQQSTGQQIACEAPPSPTYHPATEPWKKYWKGRWGNKEVSHDHGSQERPGKRHWLTDSGHREINMSAPKALPNQHDTHAEQNANGGGQCVGVPPAQMVFHNQNLMPLQQNANDGDQFAGALPANMGLQNHNGVQPGSNNHSSFFAEQNAIGGGQLRQPMPNMQGPPHNDWHQVNMSATGPGSTTGHHSAQNNANFFTDHNTAQVNYHGITGPGLVRNNTNSFMDHAAAQSNHSTVNGRGDAQKRKRSDL
ncbi:hypothetical protein LA080_014139 [Diaporthe eres]|uniref:Uncharacterized protein n=1 Tax=Diaporthe vaccinii TaxID=105482 RepID=A0ABR4F6U6_9PEZI|nr:hypothetical protein LA080_014139 [Diaporthe eres]